MKVRFRRVGGKTNVCFGERPMNGSRADMGRKQNVSFISANVKQRRSVDLA